jgi:hypothetical protein
MNGETIVTLEKDTMEIMAPCRLQVCASSYRNQLQHHDSCGMSSEK